MSIDWSGEFGATHCDKQAWCFYKLEGDTWKLHLGNDEWCNSDSMYNGETKVSDLIQRPQSKPWSGPEDGLPPVGLECEVDHGNGKHWDKVTIVAHHCEKAIYLDPVRGIHYIWGLVKDFRTVRTPDQIASDARETAIAEMAKVLPSAKHECWTCNPDGSVKPYENTHEILGLLVDAGFKREVV